MQGQTKLAVGIGAVLICAGGWYATKPANGPVSPTAAVDASSSAKLSVAEPVKPEDKPAAKVTPAVESKTDKPLDNNAHASGVASPSPRNIESRLPGTEEKSRPQPLSTDEPAAPLSAGDLPERSGLSSITPSIPPSVKENLSPTSPVADIAPPSVAAKDASTSALPAPSHVATGNSTTKPSDASAAIKSTVAPVLPPEAGTVKAGTPTSVATAVKPHVVQSGDTYSSLAVKYLGHAKYANLIMKANPGRDAKKLYIGAKINIPERPTDAPAVTVKPENAAVAGTSRTARANAKEVVLPPDPSRAYTVKPGEGWMDLARRFLGDSKEYPELYELNKERVGGNPNILPAGTVIELPKRAKLAATGPAAKSTTAAPVKSTAAAPAKAPTGSAAKSPAK